MDSAKDLWDNQKSRSFTCNGPRVQELKAAISNCRQNGDNVFNYYGKLKRLWDELANYQKFADCCCDHSCDCTIDTKSQQNEEKLHQIILCLDDAVFNTVTSQILNMDPLHVNSNAYAMIVMEERRQIVAQHKQTRAEVAFVARTIEKSSQF